MRTISLIFLICQSSFLLSQVDLDQAIQGEWIQKGSKFDTTLGDGYGELFDARYVRMSFRKGILEISYSPFEAKNFTFKYEIEKDTIRYGNSKFILVLPSNNRLRLQTTFDTVAVVLNRLIPRKSEEYKVGIDTIYNASFHLTPRFNGDLTKTLFLGGFIDYPPVRKDKAIDVEFTLLSTGKISDVTISSPHFRWRNKRFKKTLLKYQDNWEAPLVNGKRVSTAVKLQVVRKGGRNLRLHQKAERYFNLGLDLIERRPHVAVQHLTMAHVVQPDNAKYYFYRATSYYKLRNENMMCSDLVAAQEICPFLPIYFIDRNMGIEVRCIKR